jgi:hypothetical protein
MIATSTAQSSQLANRFNIIEAVKTQSYFRLGMLRKLVASLAILMDRARVFLKQDQYDCCAKMPASGFSLDLVVEIGKDRYARRQTFP